MYIIGYDVTRCADTIETAASVLADKIATCGPDAATDQALYMLDFTARLLRSMYIPNTSPDIYQDVETGQLNAEPE